MSAGATKETAADASLSSDGKVQVNLNDKVACPEPRRIVAIAGHPPLDTPYWVKQTLTDYDRRRMASYSLRFTAVGDDQVDILLRQDEVRRAIWEAVGQEMERRNVSGSLPAVLIEKGRFEVGEKDVVRVDVICDNDDLCNILINCMKQIRIQQAGQEAWTIFLESFSNSLDADILPFDLLRLPLTAENSDAIMKSLDTMVKDVGHVIGIGKFEYTDPAHGFSHGPSHVYRGYIKLSPASMTLAFAALARSLPTHFVWHQIPYPLRYAGRGFHDEAVHSANFPVEEAENNDEANSSASSSGSTTLVESSSDESNKRKRSRK